MHTFKKQTCMEKTLANFMLDSEDDANSEDENSKHCNETSQCSGEPLAFSALSMACNLRPSCTM